MTGRLTLDFAQTVAIGPFNPHIITIDWLLSQGIVTESEADDTDSFPDFHDEDDAGFVLGGFEWDVSLSRLAVTSYGAVRDCGAAASRVMKELHHTPVRAVGNNFAFSCTPSVWGDRPKPALLPERGAFPGVSPRNVRWIGQYSGMAQGGTDRPTVEVDVLYAPLGIVIQLNFDRPAGKSEVAQRRAEAFPGDYDQAREIVQHLFSIDVP